MRINNNMAALNAWKSMSTNNTNLTKSLERLSSGYRVNKAADDAAGLAVSEKMRAQLRGIGMAIRNTGDGVSLMQTAEGGASKIQEAVQRMRELAVQAGSDGLQNEDREKLQEEFSQLISAIDNTTETVKFNGRTLLDGSSGSKATLDSGSSISAATVTSFSNANAPSSAKLKVNVTAVATMQSKIGTTGTDSAAGAVDFSTGGTLDSKFQAGDLADGDTIAFTQGSDTLTIYMQQTNDSGVAVRDMTSAQFVSFVNTKAQDNDMAFRISQSGQGFAVNSNTVGSTGNVTINETFAGGGVSFGLEGAGVTTVGGTDATASVTYSTDGGSTYSSSGNYAVTGSGNTLSGANYVAGLSLTAATTGESVVDIGKSDLDFQTGANEGEIITASLANLTTTNLGIDSLDVSTKSGATTAITDLDNALSTLNTERAQMGAIQNRLDNQISSLQTQYENLTAAESRIRDVDMASEMAQFTKYQVLSQASSSMLSQANQLSQGVLSLLR